MKSATRFLKRFACLALAAILSLTCLAACGGGEGGGGSGKTKLKVFLYMNDHEKEVYSAMVEKFKEAHADEVSDIEFQITTQSEYATTLTGMMTANDMPDVFYVGPERVKDYVSNGYVANLTPLLSSAGISTDDLPQGILDFYRYDGTNVGSADLYMLYQFIWSNDASFTSEDGKTITIDDPKFVDALQKYIDLTLKYQVTPTVEQDTALGPYQRWIAGQTGFYAAGTWDVASFMDPETFPYNWDLCYYPTMSSGKSYTWSGTVGFCVSEASEHKDLALQLISYLSTDPEGQKDLSGMTGNASVQVPNLLSLQDEFKQMVAGGTMTYPSNVDVIFNYLNGTGFAQGRMMETTYTPNTEWIDMFWEQLTDVKAGKRDINEFISSIKPEMQASLDKAWANAG